ncbi:unnamed protein product [Somion occarium]|uniref:Uncharacterized protein n=1 Tax=Somion occarium TaxID=3059160 RepID=A0ABP1DEK1_9APHY
MLDIPHYTLRITHCTHLRRHEHLYYTSSFRIIYHHSSIAFFLCIGIMDETTDTGHLTSAPGSSVFNRLLNFSLSLCLSLPTVVLHPLLSVSESLNLLLCFVFLTGSDHFSSLASLALGNLTLPVPILHTGYRRRQTRRAEKREDGDERTRCSDASFVEIRSTLHACTHAHLYAQFASRIEAMLSLIASREGFPLSLSVRLRPMATGAGLHFQSAVGISWPVDMITQ